MSTQLQAQVKAKPMVSSTSTRTGMLQRKCACGQHTMAGEECAECRQKREGMLQRAAVNAAPMNAVPPIVPEVLSSSGQLLDAETRAFMEPRFGYDFSQVRVHADERAAESARAVNALAYTVGQDVVFGAGQYAPMTSKGRRLLAHELTHVVQQGKRRPFGKTVYRASPGKISPTGLSNHEQMSTTERLLAIIEDIERVHSYVNKQLASEQSGDEAVEGQQYLETMATALPQLRSIANSSDEDLKLRILAAFSPQMLKSAEMRFTEQASSASVDIREQEVEKLAAKPIQISDPQDAAEIEADRIAATVLSDTHILIAQTASGNVVSRAVGEALMAAGTVILTTEAEAAPGEAAGGPPVWVVVAAAAVVAGLLIGTGYILMSQHGRGNVADTGIIQEVNNLIAAGLATTVCAALDILMGQAAQAGDTERMQRIKATQKAKGCRGSRNL